MKSAAAANAASIPTRRSVYSSMSASVKAVAIARPPPIASRCSRWKPNSAASGGLINRTATRIFPASKAFARALSPCMAASFGKADRAAADPSALFADLPMPSIPALDGAFNILVTGIGGTGVITIGALLGAWRPMARRQGLLDARLHTGDCRRRTARSPAMSASRRRRMISPMSASDPAAPTSSSAATSSSPPSASRQLSRAEARRHRARSSTPTCLPTATTFVHRSRISTSRPARCANCSMRPSSTSDLDILDATGLASALMGDSIATNSFMLGFAFQRGAIPLSLEAIMKAIDVLYDGAAIEMNKLAFSWGRLAAHDLQRVVSAARFKNSGSAPARRTLEESIAFRAGFLTDYQNEAYSKRYLAEVERITAPRKAKKAAPWIARPDRGICAKACIKLMAYKDEYEVARLLF